MLIGPEGAARGRLVAGSEGSPAKDGVADGERFRPGKPGSDAETEASDLRAAWESSRGFMSTEVSSSALSSPYTGGRIWESGMQCCCC